MLDAGDVTLPELARRVQKVEGRVENGVWVRADVHDLAVAYLNGRITELEESLKWAWRLAVTSILGLIAAIITGFALNLL